MKLRKEFIALSLMEAYCSEKATRHGTCSRSASFSGFSAPRRALCILKVCSRIFLSLYIASSLIVVIGRRLGRWRLKPDFGP